MTNRSWKFDYAAAQNSPTLKAESVARTAAAHSRPAEVKEAITLTKGWPSASLHPREALLDGIHAVFSDANTITPALQYGPDPGFQPLRESISSWLAGYYGAEDTPDRITVTGGASQNVANVLAGFADPNVTKRIWMMCPTYFLAGRIFEDAGYAGRLRAVPEDGEGMSVEWLRGEMEKLRDEEPRGPPTKTTLPWRKTYTHIIYCVPTFSNPSTTSMPASRRLALVQLAAEHNALIITDDVYDFLHWPTLDVLFAESDISGAKAILPRLSDIERTTPGINDPDGFGFTLSNGSFSKILGPGVRTGWADCNPKLAFGLSQVGSSKSGGAPSQLTATFIDQMLRKGSLQRHIAKTLCPAYQQRWMAIMRAIQHELGPLGVTTSRHSLQGQDVFGGYFVWLTLPKGVDADMVALWCQWEENLTLSPGSAFEVPGESEVDQKELLGRCVRLCFSYMDIELLVEGVRRLGRVIREVLAADTWNEGRCGRGMMDGLGAAVRGTLEHAKEVHGMAKADRGQVRSDEEQPMERLQSLEGSLPNLGSWLRTMYLRGVNEEVPESEGEEIMAMVRELDELIRKCRAKVLEGWSEKQVEEWCAQEHARHCEYHVSKVAKS